jgi:hypothetical protein
VKIAETAALHRSAAKASPGLPGVRFFDGAWSMMVTFDEPLGMWCFSACLWPRGRGSTLEDWRLLGEWAKAIGVPDGCECLGNTIETQANAVHKWFWPEPGRGATPHQEHAAASPASSSPAAGIGFESRGSVTGGRNDPCPCGSGRKYKRCCLDKPHSFGTCECVPERCSAKAIGVFYCKLCPKGAEKHYAYCGRHEAMQRQTMAGHCSRVHPAAFPDLMKKIAASHHDLSALRARAAESPALWSAQLAEVEKYVVPS